MTRRPDRTALALAVPVLLFVLFGMARVAAPVSALGLVFHHPLTFAAVAAITSLAGAALLFNPRVELRVSRFIGGDARPPSDAELARLEHLLEPVGRRAGIDVRRLVLRVQTANEINAGAGASHLLFVTTRALGLADAKLGAILAHELGHHRGLHPVLTTVVWWLSLPGVALAAVYGFLRRQVARVGGQFGALGRVVAVPLVLLLVVWQIAVMWIFYVADLLSKRAARVSELAADDAAAHWGYGSELAAALESAAGQEGERPGLLARLTALHPPVAERVERLRRQAPAESSPFA